MINSLKIVEDLKIMANRSEAINNKFYDKWLEEEFSVRQLEVFLSNYFARTINTASRVCDVVKILINPHMIIKNDLYARSVAKNLQNLQDELGDGSSKKAHILLLREWSNELLLKYSSNLCPIEYGYKNFILKETTNFNILQKEIYNSDSIYTVLGAALTQEIFADVMMLKLNDGFIKNYAHKFSSEKELSDATLYFRVHIDGTELMHSRYIEDILSFLVIDENAESEIKKSYEIFEKITIDFWQAIYKVL